MFSYVMLGTNDLQRAISFYDPLMELLGHPKAGRNEEGASWGTFSDNHTTGLCIGMPFDQQRAGTGNGTMVALNAHSFEHIAQLHALALSLGGTNEGAPGHRPHYGAGFHSAYVRDPDGNKLAFVFYSNEGLTSN
ncbi:VOC family protein [Klebsiella sp. CN_Kp098]|uniref:Glyoxalase n=1 Tax=Enterobacter genomosp. O TaxID=2364150 RepID=A0A0X4EFP2_9ENTR|nr:VOC family protein [Enterobacter genomosp. O]KUQ80526.1 glyoxalase [Enterobacter genomosp. O]